MARISLDPPQTLSSRIAEWFIRRRFGEVLEPMRIIGHHPQVSRAVGQLEQHAQRWRRMDVKIRDLAEMAAVAKVGCSWCMDFGYWVMHGHGLSREKIEAVPHWRDSELFDPLERLVIEYAEAMTETPPTVDDELVKRLLEHLDEAQGYSPQVGAVGLEPPPSASRARASGYHPLSRSVITSDEQNPAGCNATSVRSSHDFRYPDSHLSRQGPRPSVQQEVKDVGGGKLIASVKDPDGNVIGLIQVTLRGRAPGAVR